MADEQRSNGQLRVSGYAFSQTGQNLNLDNMYMNGRYVNIDSESDSKMTRTVSNDFQVYGVSDSDIGVDDDRQLGAANGSVVMDMLQRTQNSLNSAEKINKDHIWDAVVEASQTVKAKRTELGREPMGTSFAALFLHGNRGLAVHLGDSRIYVIRNGRMLQITDDHLESSDMFRLGILTQAQAEVHKKDSRLTAYVGMDDVYEAHDEAFSKYFIFYPGDTFILCTDGLSDAIPNEEMERVCRLLKDAPANELANMLLKEASEKTQADTTIIVLKIDSAPGEAPKRGSGTIPRRENYENQETRVAPVAPRLNRASEQEERPGASSANDQRQAANGHGGEEDSSVDAENAEDFRNEQPEVQRPRRLSSINENTDYPDDEEEEESLLDRLTSDPKRLAMIIGIVVVVIILLIVIISAARRAGRSSSNSSTPVVNSATEESSTAVVVVPGTSTVDSSTIESSAIESSMESSIEESSTGEVGEYTVQEGDSFYSIVLNEYGSADADLMNAFAEYNGTTIDGVLMPGDVLKVPPMSELTGVSTESSAEESTEESTLEESSEESTTGE